MDFRDMSEKQLQQVLKFTEAIADGRVNFADMKTTDESLAEAEREAIAFAERRKSGLRARSTFAETDEEAAETKSIREQIKDYYKRTRKIVKG